MNFSCHKMSNLKSSRSKSKLAHRKMGAFDFFKPVISFDECCWCVHRVLNILYRIFLLNEWFSFFACAAFTVCKKNQSRKKTSAQKELIGVAALSLSLSRFLFDESVLNWNECALFVKQVRLQLHLQWHISTLSNALSTLNNVTNVQVAINVAKETEN